MGQPAGMQDEFKIQRKIRRYNQSNARVCVITGASGGIGTEVVKKYYNNGYDVVMLDINEDTH